MCMREIVFFDGACGVCNGFVIRTAANDRAERFFYAPLGGLTARQCGIDETDSVVVVVEDEAHGNRIYFRSRAVLYLMKHQDSAFLRGVAHVFAWIPAALLDVLYRGVAKIRHLVPTSGKRAADSSFATRILP